MTKEEYFTPSSLNREIWKDLPKYEGIYQVSNLGRVKSLDRINANGAMAHGKLMSPQDNKHGYLYVDLCKNGKLKREYIHRLVGMTFIPNTNNLPQINHKNEIKSDNRAENLEWCDNRYNNNYGTARIRARYTMIMNGNNRAIDVYSVDGKFIKTYECAYDMEKDGISRRNVYLICDGRCLSYHGLAFRYHGEEYKEREKINLNHSNPIYKYNADNELVEVYPSVTKAEKANGLNRNYIYSASYRHTRVVEVNGYKFSYYPLNDV